MFRVLDHGGPRFQGTVCTIVKFGMTRRRVLLPVSIRRGHVSGPSFCACSSCTPFAVGKRGRRYAVVVCASQGCRNKRLDRCLGMKLIPLSRTLVPGRGSKGTVVCSVSRTRSFRALIKRGAPCAAGPRRVVTRGFTLTVAKGGGIPGPRLLRGAVRTLGGLGWFGWGAN